MNTLVVCHVEFGYVTDSVVFDRRKREGAANGITNTIRIAEGFNAKVSFMIMPEVLQAVSGIDFRGHEIGLHIHPDDSLLMKKGIGGARYLRDYGYEKQKDMISAGKEVIKDTLGVSPRTFVAGKWSVSNATVRALVELGFTHDGSPCPGHVSNWCHWGKLPRICMPYKPSEHDYQLNGNMDLVMVPVSRAVIGGIVSPESRVGSGFLRAAFQEYRSMGLPFFHITFHSPAMTSPHYQRVFGQLLKHIRNCDIDFSPLCEVKPVRGKVMPPVKKLLPYLTNLDSDALSYVLRLPFRGSRMKPIL